METLVLSWILVQNSCQVIEDQKFISVSLKQNHFRLTIKMPTKLQGVRRGEVLYARVRCKLRWIASVA